MKTLEDRVLEVLPDYVSRDSSGNYFLEPWTDYRDELSDSHIEQIMRSTDPRLTFSEIIWEAYEEHLSCLRWHCAENIAEDLSEDDSRIDPVDVNDILMDHVEIRPPEKEFLKQDINVLIAVDAGDVNYDFSINAPWRSYWGEGVSNFDENSSLLWLIRQQGHTKREAREALHMDGYPENPFMKSVMKEIESACNCMNALVFCVEMTLNEWFLLNDAMKQEEAGEVKYYPRQSRGRGYIVLDKNVTCGLFNPWLGGGSMLEIRCEKDVKLPLRYIYSARLDGMWDQYGVDDVYGSGRGLWTDSLKEIHKMKKKLEKKDAKHQPSPGTADQWDHGSAR